MSFDKKIPRNEWNHLCVTWTPGAAQFFVNGISVDLTGDPPTKQIQLGGTLVVGQEQDSPGGDFDIDDLYTGE